ncbi:MAG: stage III sporulation AC/AD family protein [Eubacterium sp.]|nr:stage III sporulation AC/AD family protein [Eubacterium sp.]
MTVVIGISITALILSLFLKDYNKTVSLILVLFSSALLFFKIVGSIGEITDTLKEITDNAGELSSYLKLMLKVLGIALITQITADICRDCGETALAGQTEVAAKIIIVAMILPLFEAVVKIISGLLV